MDCVRTGPGAHDTKEDEQEQEDEPRQEALSLLGREGQARRARSDRHVFLYCPGLARRWSAGAISDDEQAEACQSVRFHEDHGFLDDDVSRVAT